ncbi:TetR family transcriptional regulator [Streptomyces sp. NPDC051940]|uniref:TetR/AcrR family transcriptional regulator n=1 Tax=Streptomyces sp. NPDC051940 TaxID=3155675 RepID=UPI00344302BD
MSSARTQGDGPARIGRPPLTERRKDATRLEIAHEAVRLFAERGVQATSGEDIARAAGISTRTLWRYFPAKEQCVRPLLTQGLDILARRLVDLPADRSLGEVAESAEPAGSGVDAGTLRSLIRLTRTEPAIMAVWLQVHYAAEDVFGEVIATRLGLPADSLDVRVRATMLNGALRVASEEWAFADDGAADPQQALRAALRIVSAGLNC